jgi:hypothetical protein
MKKLLLFLALCAWASAPALAQTADDDFSRDIRTLIKASGLEEALRGTAGMALDRLQQLKPRVPQEAWDNLAAEADSMSLEPVYAQLVPAYREAFTHAEVKKLLRFYRKKLGRKVAFQFAPLQEATGRASLAWGNELGSHFAQRLAEMGY